MARPLPPVTPPWTGPRPPVSVVILTLDEEINIGACLASCAWADDVHVLDSGSRDRTAELARAAGASVYVNPFRSFGAQRNWAIDHIPLRHDWVFHLDADERFTPDLVREIAAILSSDPPPAEAGFFIANQMILNGAWIRRASGYPAYQVRLFHKSRLRFTDHGHGQREIALEGRAIGTLRTPYLHFNFSKGLDDWRARHDRYSTLEAQQIVATDGQPLRLGSLFSSDRVARRRALKQVASRMPLRPTARLVHALVAQGAILDGRAGLTYARLLAGYERMIARKVRQLRADGAAAQRS